MRHLTLLAAVSALSLATPAYAAGHGYVGFDAGLLMPDDVDFEYDSDDAFEAELNNGFDLDLIGGYDFGFIRVEGELAWKRATHSDYSDSDISINADGETDVRSIMINGLGDFGTDKWSFYAGGGVGFARVRNRIELDDQQQLFNDDFSLKDSGFAWQLIAGVRYSVNEIIDIGLKYRYFDTSDLNDDDLDFDFNSHSIMFSFINNVGGRLPPPPPPPPLPPPPPPPPPATQTCPDGSVILATDACPPPPPPPPPPPEPERG